MLAGMGPQLVVGPPERAEVRREDAWLEPLVDPEERLELRQRQLAQPAYLGDRDLGVQQRGGLELAGPSRRRPGPP
jgi:hypothetical protein